MQKTINIFTWYCILFGRIHFAGHKSGFCMWAMRSIHIIGFLTLQRGILKLCAYHTQTTASNSHFSWSYEHQCGWPYHCDLKCRCFSFRIHFSWLGAKKRPTSHLLLRLLSLGLNSRAHVIQPPRINLFVFTCVTYMLFTCESIMESMLTRIKWYNREEGQLNKYKDYVSEINVQGMVTTQANGPY